MSYYTSPLKMYGSQLSKSCSAKLYKTCKFVTGHFTQFLMRKHLWYEIMNTIIFSQIKINQLHIYCWSQCHGPLVHRDVPANPVSCYFDPHLLNLARGRCQTPLDRRENLRTIRWRPVGQLLTLDTQWPTCLYLAGDSCAVQDGFRPLHTAGQAWLPTTSMGLATHSSQLTTSQRSAPYFCNRDFLSGQTKSKKVKVTEHFKQVLYKIKR